MCKSDLNKLDLTHSETKIVSRKQNNTYLVAESIIAQQLKHTSSPNFLGGSSDENEKVLRKFLPRLRRAK